MDTVRNHVLSIDSTDRGVDSTSPEDGIYHLNDSHLHQVKSIRFKSLTFANTMYNINAYNNTLNYELVGVPKTVNIPVGSYTVATLVIAFNLAQADIVVANNATTNVFAFTSGSNTKILATSTIGRVLGVTTDTVNGLAYNGNQIYNLTYTYMIHVLSNALARSDNLISSNRKKWPVICSIPMDKGYSFLVHHEEKAGVDTADFSVHNGHVNLSSIDIKIVDDDYRVIDLNGSRFVIQFLITNN